MAWQTLTYKLTSEAPLIMHNGQTANPLNKFAKAMKAISGKRKKTDADIEEMARIEFLASLYVGPDGPIIPARLIDSMLTNAAKKNREGQLSKSGLFCLKDACLEYDGPRTPDEMWQSEQFRRSDIVRVQSSRVVRTRANFTQWAVTVEVSHEDTIVNAAQIDAWFQIGGTQIGLGDWRPQHGRFTAERLPE